MRGRLTVEKAEILTNIGILLGAIFAGIIAYFGKRPPEKPGTKDTVVAGLGIEFGNRLQVDQAIAELKRIADSLAIIADRKQATTEAKLDRILEELDEAEEREREKANQMPRPARPPRSRKPRQ
jgi:hypothetical protein